MPPLVAGGELTLKVQASRELLRAPLQKQLLLHFAPPLRGHLPTPPCGARLPTRRLAHSRARPHRGPVRGRSLQDVGRAASRSRRSIRRVPSACGSGNVRRRSGDDSLNLRFSLTEIIRIAWPLRNISMQTVGQPPHPACCTSNFKGRAEICIGYETFPSCVVTSTTATRPSSTADTARRSTSARFFGSLTGPSAQAPKPRATCAKSMTGSRIA